MGSDLLVLSPDLLYLEFLWFLWSLPCLLGKRWELSHDPEWLLDLCLLDHFFSKPLCAPFSSCSSSSNLSIFRFLLSSSTLILTLAVWESLPRTPVLLASWLPRCLASPVSAWISNLIPLVCMIGGKGSPASTKAFSFAIFRSVSLINSPGSVLTFLPTDGTNSVA